MICTICEQNPVGADARPGTDYCWACWTVGNNVVREIAPWLVELNKRARATIEWIGGGLKVMSIPAGENGRYVWLGWTPSRDGDGPWAEAHYPHVGEFLTGYVYLPVEDDILMAPLSAISIDDNSPEALTRYALTLATEGMKMPTDQMEFC